MNNEETIIAQPKSKKQYVSMKGNQGKGKMFASAAAAATVGGFVGAAGTAAAMSHNEEEEVVIPKQEEQKPQNNEVDTEEVEVSATDQPSEPQVTAVVDSSSEPDYTSHENADPVLVEDPQTAQATMASNVSEPEVQVLGVYERTTEEGIHQTAAVLTNGEEVAAVVDTTGDGYANVMAMDSNGNGQFDEGEVHDISDHGISMNNFEDAYLDQQQMNDMAYNASNDDMQDYVNDANLDA